MTAGDRVVERAASRLRDTASRWAGEGGLKAKLAEPLADDAEFLRNLKPSLVRARAKGELPTDETAWQPPAAPTGAELGQRPKARRTNGPNPFVVMGVAFAAGVLLAKIIDWRSHAHPRN